MERFDPSKVYGGTARYKGDQRHAIAFAPTKKRLLEIIGQSPRHFKDYWCETGNVTALGISDAARKAGATEGVWVETGSFSGEYIRVNEGEVDGQ